MPRIPLEDNFTDVIGKAQRGLQLADEALAAQAGVTVDELKAAKGGEIRRPCPARPGQALGLERDALLALARREWYPEHPSSPAASACSTPARGHDGQRLPRMGRENPPGAAFDTGSNAQPMLDLIASENLTLRYIFLTHTHDDHIADLPRLAATGAEVWASELEPAPHPGAKTFQENAHFHLGELSIKTLFTWGHSPGQTSFYITGLAWPLAIVGDSLFAGSMGGGLVSYEIQLRNNRQKLMKLPLDTVFACGHGPLTTLKQEKKHNPFFAR